MMVCGSPHSLPWQVVTTGKLVSRETLAKNTDVVFIAVQELGYRVSVDTCSFHVEAFYNDVLQAGVPGPWAKAETQMCWLAGIHDHQKKTHEQSH